MFEGIRKKASVFFLCLAFAAGAASLLTPGDAYARSWLEWAQGKSSDEEIRQEAHKARMEHLACEPKSSDYCKALETKRDQLSKLYQARISGNIKAVDGILNLLDATEKVLATFHPKNIADKVWDLAKELAGFCRLRPVSEMRNTLAPEGAGAVCWFKQPFATIAGMTGTIGDTVHNEIRKGAYKLAGFGFLLWLAVQVMKYVSAFQASNPGEFLTNIFTGAFRLMVVALVIGPMKAKEVVEWLISPFITGAAELGKTIVAAGAEADSEGDCKAGGVEGLSIEPVYNAVVDLLGTLNNALMLVIADGLTIFLNSFHAGTYCFPEAEYIFTGLILVAVAFVLLIAVPFKFIDVFFKLAILIAFVPLLAVAWIFPSTRRYTMAGWNSLVYIVCLLLFLSVILALIVTMFTHVGSSLKEIDFSVTPDELMNHYRDATARVFLVLATGLFSFKMLGIAPELAGFISGGSGSSVGDKIQGMAMTGAKAVGGLGAAGAGAVGGAAGIMGVKAAGGLGKLVGKATGGAAGFAKRTFGGGGGEA